MTGVTTTCAVSCATTGAAKRTTSSKVLIIDLAMPSPRGVVGKILFRAITIAPENYCSLTSTSSRKRLLPRLRGLAALQGRDAQSRNAIEIADRYAAVHIDGRIRLLTHARHRNIMFIRNVANDLLQDVLERDEAHQL